MSNVTCRVCNAENPTGSKYCNHCGALLPPSTNLICPNCQTTNPRSLLYCDNCGTRLLRDTLPTEPEAPQPEEPAATGAHRAFSLPSRPPGETGELDLNRLTDWLTTSGMKGPETSADEDPATPENPTEAVLDDWLQELDNLAGDENDLSDPAGAGVEPPTEIDDFPDWLSEATAAEAMPAEAEPVEAEPVEAEPVEAEPDEAKPAEAELVEAEPAEAELVEAEPAEAELVEAELVEAEPAEAEPVEAEPAEAEPVEAEPAEAEPPPAEESLPDWLTEAAAAEVEPPDAGQELPDWLTEGFTAEAETAAEEEQVPDWLNESTHEEAEAGEALDDWSLADGREQQQAGVEADELPDWLLLESEEPAGEEFEESTIDELDALFASYDSDLSEQEQESLEAPLSSTGELPEWLTENAPRGTGLLSPLASPEESEELPPGDSLDWLLEDSAPEAVEGIVTDDDVPAGDGGDEPDTAGDETDDVPDWPADVSAEVAAPETPAAEELFETAETGVEAADWLSLLDQIGDDASGTAAESEADLVASWFDDTGDEAWPEVPEFEPETLPDENVQTPADFKQVRDNLPPELAAAELPKWLQDSLAPDEGEGDLAGLMTPDLSELPDWLQSLEKDIEPSPEPAAQTAQPESSPAGTTEWDDILGEMPAGRDLAPDFELPPASEFAAPESSAAVTNEAEMPGWLQALRPRELEEAPEVEEQPVQTSGPLAGIRNVIEISPVVAEAHTSVRLPQFTVSRDQELQVELLRQLTRDDQKKATVVARVQAGALAVPLRLALSVLLLAALLLGYFMPVLALPLPETVAPPLPPAAQPVAPLLQNNGGRPVLLAFEYTPAFAGELDLQAAMFLRQLSAGGSPVIVVSQHTAGVPLARQATARLAGTTVHEIGFLPGEAVGLRRLGACLGSGSDCATIYGRPLAPELQQALADVGLVIVITADKGSLVNWIEQVAAQSEVPVVAAVSQSLAPVAAAYFAAGQLQGVIGGLPAVAAYERLFPTGERPGNEQLAAQTIAQWLVVLLLVLGNLWYALTALVRRYRPSLNAA
jgi:hypothetical protein